MEAGTVPHINADITWEACLALGPSHTLWDHGLHRGGHTQL
jgi:hypothetical protein